MQITVSAPSGLEGVVKREIYKLTGLDSTAINGRVEVSGDLKTVALFNLHLRTASRVFIKLGSFKAQTFDELFDGVSLIDFENYIDKKGKIEVYGSSIESKLTSVQACASIIKKAICKRLISKYDTELTESGERYKIEFILRRDYCIISLDTSGESLNKRGYRKELIGDAPLKENVAAALILLSVWNKSRPLADLFCGSGTIPIEGALIAKNIAPGLYRDFDFLRYKKFDLSFWEDMKKNAINSIDNETELKIYAFDIEESQIRLARKHAEKAGVLDAIHFQRADMREFSSRLKDGVIITNPPYGERLLDRKTIVSLYRDYGEVYSKLNNWSAYTLTSVTDFERLFRKKANKKRKIYNGKLECNYFSVLGEKPEKTDKKFTKKD
ncbi:MAG: class I SAM-dependent RNA methyltransferase [Clostridia bacterium]|nr:class I SAM-dependent RNA methyltransferase [Clostridia bacterium]